MYANLKINIVVLILQTWLAVKTFNSNVIGGFSLAYVWKFIVWLRKS